MAVLVAIAFIMRQANTGPWRWPLPDPGRRDVVLSRARLHRAGLDIPRLVGSGTRPLVLNWSLGGSLVFADEAAKDEPTLDLLLG